MVDTTKVEVKSARDIYYYRRRLKNRIFSKLSSFFAEEAQNTGITRKDLALRLNKDPAQITRWLSGPSNLTLDSLSDLLLAMGAEADPPQIVKFSDRPTPNYVHPLIAYVTGVELPVNKTASTTGTSPGHFDDGKNTTVTTSGRNSVSVSTTT